VDSLTQELSEKREFLTSLGNSRGSRTLGRLRRAWSRGFECGREALNKAFISWTFTSPGDFFSVIDQVQSSVSEIYAGELGVLKSTFFHNIDVMRESVAGVLGRIGRLDLVERMIPWYEDERATVDFVLNTWSEVESERVESLVKRAKEFWPLGI
jgi:hypothetical protein